ncbi:MAG: DUF1674 domain-containing protein [Candidatus Thiosymbion ectosymbiont of Robbea hypermnestra]|nr:DUF1674 domain-containing protein [Candidatus Thiosymbion ectosymbiont of Robbea hypermnestra]
MSRADQSESGGETPMEGAVPGADEKGKEGMQPRDRREIGGPPGPEPTRYGDWEKAGRCIDF